MNPASNPGAFMSPVTGQPPGTGSALMRLMQLRQQGATPNAVQNPGSSGYVPPAAPPTGNAINPSQISAAGRMGSPPGGDVAGAGAPPMPSGMGSGASVAPNSNGVNMTFDPHEQALQVAMEALSNYVQSHGKSYEAKNDVPRKQAEAKLIASQAQSPTSAPVS